MIRPIMGRIPKHKQFNYQYRYYKPEPAKDGEGLEFHRITRRGNGGSVLAYAVLLAFVLYLIVTLAS